MTRKRGTRKRSGRTLSNQSQSKFSPKELRARLGVSSTLARAAAQTPNPNPIPNGLSVPQALRSEINQAIAERPKGLESVRKIYDLFKLKNHGVAYTTFAEYVRHEGWRSRLGAAGQVVDALFGQAERTHAEQLCNAAYLHLMAAVVQALQENTEEIPTAELVKLSKIIAEQRAVAAKERDVELKNAKRSQSAGGDEQPKPSRTGLPENFDDIVRRIYGVDVKDEIRRTKDKKSS